MRTILILFGVLAFCAHPASLARGMEHVPPMEDPALTPALSLTGVDEVPFLICAGVFFSSFPAKNMAPGTMVATRSQLPIQHFSEGVVSLVQELQDEHNKLVEDVARKSAGRKYKLLPLKETAETEWLALARELEKRETSETMTISEETYLELLRRLDSDVRSQVHAYVREVACGDGIRLSSDGEAWDSDIFDRSSTFEVRVEEELQR